MAKPALGRGLGALLGGATPHPVPTAPPPTPPSGQPVATATPGSAEGGEKVQLVALEQIRRSPFQPRKDFSDGSLQELADSIKEQGIIQPLIVRAQPDHFELIAGERRWRAAELAGLKKVPIIVRAADDNAVLEMALIENLQRENLNPIEEALGYAQLIDQFKLRQEDVAQRVGKSRASVANALRLLNLSSGLQQYVRTGRLSLGHAKVILGLSAASLQALAADKVLRDGLNVRQTEELVTHLQNLPAATASKSPANATPARRDAHVSDLENRLRERLGTKVQLRYRLGKGSLDIRFYSDDELERILQIVGVNAE